MSLRLRISLIVTALMLLSVAAAGSILIADARAAIREEIQASTRITSQLLAGVVYSAQLTGSPRDFLLAFMRSLGRVRANEIKLYDPAGDLVYQSPPSSYKAGRSAPDWYARLVGPHVEPVSIVSGGARLEIVPDASRSTLDAWEEHKQLGLAVVALFLLANAALVWWIGRVTRPLATIVAGLARMAKGGFDTRLPDFSAPEFARVSKGFNHMVASLEQAMQESRRLALVAQQSSDAIMIVDPTERITFWNAAAERMLGYLSDEMTGREAQLLILASDRDAFSATLAEAVARRPVGRCELHAETRSGALIDAALSAAPLVEPPSGEVIGAILTLRDITEQKRAQRAERELSESRELAQLIDAHREQERQTLARELHDELGQCVTAIRTLAVSIANRAGESSPQIRTQAQSISDIATRIYDGMHDIVRRLRPVVLDELGLAEALKEEVRIWRERHPEITFDLALAASLDGLGKALNITLYRIVQECLTNVVRHSGASRAEVSVAREPDERIHLHVRDNGRGAPDDRGGFGLLGIRERVQALHGTFRIVGEPAGGTEVEVILPVT